jgi:8-oxo-dGTP pyrophosphatase MutT (NUDIX family)
MSGVPDQLFQKLLGEERAEDDARVKMLALQAEKPLKKRRPVDAATLIILNTEAKEPELLMGRRNPALKFMPNKFVFPGGRVDKVDRAMAVAGILDADVEQALLLGPGRLTTARARALALTCIRETFEETGLLIGSKDFGVPVNPPEGAWRSFAAHGVYPSLETLNFIARAITPPGRPRRFDTRFFVVNAREIVHRVENLVGPDAELVELRWVTLSAARQLELPGITHLVLNDLSERLETGLGKRRPVPFYFERRRTFQRTMLEWPVIRQA